MFVYPQLKPYIELLTPDVVIFVSGAFWKWLGHEDGALINGIIALIKRSYRAPELLILGKDVVTFLWYFVILAA